MNFPFLVKVVIGLETEKWFLSVFREGDDTVSFLIFFPPVVLSGKFIAMVVVRERSCQFA